MKKTPMRFERYPYVITEFVVPYEGCFRLVATVDQTSGIEKIFIERLYRNNMNDDLWATYNQRDQSFKLIPGNIGSGMFEQGGILHAIIRSLNIECDHRDWNE